MKENYPQSIPLAFHEFPPVLWVNVGRFIRELDDSMSHGQRFKLVQTPSHLPDGLQYAEGAPLPDYCAVYSDTGQDGEFSLRLVFYGQCTFFKHFEGDAYCTMEILKGIRVETGSGGRWVECECTEYGETMIPVADMIKPTQFVYGIGGFEYDVVVLGNGTFKVRADWKINVSESRVDSFVAPDGTEYFSFGELYYASTVSTPPYSILISLADTIFYYYGDTSELGRTWVRHPEGFWYEVEYSGATITREAGLINAVLG